MKKFILGTKQQMTQLFTDDGNSVVVTVVNASPCVITQVNVKSVQLGYRKKKIKNVTKAQQGHLKGLPLVARFKEFRVDDTAPFKRGETVSVHQFAVGDKVKVSGVSKGKGFQGVVRRHHFAGSPATHGHKDQLRHSGSIGATAPQRVMKGRRMAGHMGTERVTATNVAVVKVDEQANQLYLKGAIPGARNNMVEVYA